MPTTDPQPPTPDDYTEDDFRTMEACEELSRLANLWIYGHYYDYCNACEKRLIDQGDHDCGEDGHSVRVVPTPFLQDMFVGKMITALGPHLRVDKPGKGYDWLVEVKRHGEWVGSTASTLSLALAGACAICWHRGWEPYEEDDR